jgi:adenylate cyclase
LDRSGIAGEVGFRIGIGLSAGTVRIGMVGAKDRLQATAIGDAVNVASRLQEATKTVGRPILMSHAAYLLVADQIEAEPMGELSVRGKQEPQAVYYPIRVAHAAR